MACLVAVPERTVVYYCHLWRIDGNRCFAHPENFKITAKHVPKKHLQIYLRKGVFPYDYLTNFDIFNETKLPPKEAFYSKLYDSNISDEDYKYAQYVWKVTNCKTFKDYHDIYLKTDVLLLADVFQNFRETAYKNYGLDPLWYYSTPGFAWDILFWKTKQELELITDPNMHLTVEQGLRGGISMVSHRYAKANISNTKDFDENKPKSNILYLDATNLYGWAMIQLLPTGGFKWVKNEQELNNIKVKINKGLIPDDAEKGYILKVKLSYPKHLHKAHTEYPLAPERIKAKTEWLSKKQKELLEKSGNKHTPTDKLIPNLFDKDEYVIHYRNLQYYIKKGMVLEHIYEAIVFDQSP